MSPWLVFFVNVYLKLVFLILLQIDPIMFCIDCLFEERIHFIM